MNVRASPGVTIALPTHALLVDLIPARVGLAGEDGRDGSSQGELIKFIIHSGPLFPMIQWIPTIHSLYFYMTVFSQLSQRFKGKRSFYFIFGLYISRTLVLNQCFSHFG
jgi:hypothetical protein